MRTLTQLTLIIVTTMLITSCNRTSNKTDISLTADTVTTVDTKVTSDTTVIERYFPAKNTLNVTDTLIQTLGIQITITEKTLDTYVIEEYTNENLKYIDKYRDIEIQLKIFKDKIILVDTVFKKDTFKAFLDKGFLEVSNFNGYWINKVEVDKIEFFGVISKPETDWAFAFYHYFDIKRKEFEIKEHVDEDM